MAKRVVDFLEAVEIEAVECGALAGCRLLDGRVEPLLKQRTIGETGQAIVLREVRDEEAEGIKRGVTGYAERAQEMRRVLREMMP